MSETNLDRVEVRKTGEKGLGLFAKRDFKKTEVVLDWNTENIYLSKEELGSVPEELKKYIAYFNDRYLLIAEPERYLNHSCEPNTETNSAGLDIAIKDISAGEEITGDYTKIKTLTGFVCACESKLCKKIIPGIPT